MATTPQVTVRIPNEMVDAAKKVMRRKGILNLSDFVRQSVVSHIHAEGGMLAEPAVEFATGSEQPKQEGKK